MKRVKIAQNKDEIRKCFPVMRELRPHFQTEDAFLIQVANQRANYGFQVIYLEENEQVKAVAGIRVAEWLAGGKYLEIEDLVAGESDRSKGFGGELFDWIVEYAKRENCAQIKLVSSVKRFGAHKFYLKKGMIIEAHYFSLLL